MKNPGIYILTNTVTGKQYVGKDSDLPRRAKLHLSSKDPECPCIHNAIHKYSADAFDLEIIRYPGISYKALSAVEKWKITQLNTKSPNGYNLTTGGDGLDSETARKIARESNLQRITDGTHHFLGENNPSHKRIADGTHPFLDSEIQRRTAQKRVEDGTHHLLSKNPNVIIKLAKAKYKVVYQYTVLIPRAYWTALNSLHLHRKLTREGFFDKDIPDTSNAEQEYLF